MLGGWQDTGFATVQTVLGEYTVTATGTKHRDGRKKRAIKEGVFSRILSPFKKFVDRKRFLEYDKNAFAENVFQAHGRWGGQRFGTGTGFVWSKTGGV